MYTHHINTGSSGDSWLHIRQMMSARVTAVTYNYSYYNYVCEEIDNP